MQKVEILPGFTIEKKTYPFFPYALLYIHYNDFVATIRIDDDPTVMIAEIERSLRELKSMCPGDGQWLNKALEEQMGVSYEIAG